MKKNDRSVREHILEMYKEHLPKRTPPEGETLAEVWPRVTRMDIALSAALEARPGSPMLWLAMIDVVQNAARFLGSPVTEALEALRQAVLGKDSDEYPEGPKAVDAFLKAHQAFIAERAGVSIEELSAPGKPIELAGDWQIRAWQAARFITLAVGYRNLPIPARPIAYLNLHEAAQNAIFSIADKAGSDQGIDPQLVIPAAHIQVLDIFRTLMTADELESKPTTTMKAPKGLN